jgi:UPF0176 protein
MKAKNFQVLLYYKYIKIENTELVRHWQLKMCEELGLTGRIIIAREGINGTVEGEIESTRKYIEYMHENKLFKDIKFKKSKGTGDAFPKIRVRVRSEIVTSKIPIDPTEITGEYITAGELNSWFKSGKEFYIVDMRNDYEYISGYFENFIPSGIHNFYDLPEVLPRLNHLKNKTIVTVCTGGVRCEKASGFLLMNGFSDVYQLKDGIQTYMERYPNEHFLGKLYVFDNRLTLGFNIDSKDHRVVGRCFECNRSSDQYVNCEYDMCHFHHIRCEECLDQDLGLAFCKKECREKYLKSPQYAKLQGAIV